MMPRPLLTALVALAATPGTANVIEIDAGGAATTYDRPMVFLGEAARPAVAPPAPPVDAMVAAARTQGLPEALLHAVAWRESRGRQEAVSRKGALGVMQLMPATAAELGVDPRDRDQNILGGATYLRRQIDAFGSVALGLAAYNAGPGAVRRFGGIPPFAETRAYVRAILDRWRPDVAAPVTLAALNPLLIETP